MNTSITSSVDASTKASIILSANKKRQAAIVCLKRLRLKGIKISHTYPNPVSTLSDKDSDEESIPVIRRMVRLPRNFLEMNDEFKVVENENENLLKNDIFTSHVSSDLQIDDSVNGLKVTIIRITK